MQGINVMGRNFWMILKETERRTRVWIVIGQILRVLILTALRTAGYSQKDTARLRRPGALFSCS